MEDNHGRDNDDDDNAHQQAYVTPDLQHWWYLTASLCLCTCMAMFSAYDAKTHCLQHEALAVWQLVDDDAAVIVENNNNYEDQDADFTSEDNFKCSQMFRDVVLPSGVLTVTSALVALVILFCYIRQRSQSLPATLPSLHSDSHETNSSHSTNEPDFKSASPQEWRGLVRVTMVLLGLYVFILTLQTYNVTAIMLMPRNDYWAVDVNGSSTSYSSNNMNDANSRNNPYQSLAAVDRFGHVGGNANLYYLTWLCQVLAISLVYQVATACFRIVRTARRCNRNYRNTISDGLLSPAHVEPTTRKISVRCDASQNPSMKKIPKLLRVTSWDRGVSRVRNTKRALWNMQNRAAWYSSLYRLRVRTGMWTAASISCLIIVASSQYIWRQVLWPYISTVLRQENQTVKLRSFSYLSICQVTTSYSSSSYSSYTYYNTEFSSQLCRRTLAAWCSGLIAALLCATAIAMHQIARYSSNTGDPPTMLSPTSRRDRIHTNALGTNGAESGFEGESVATASVSHFHYYDHNLKHVLSTTEGICPTWESAWTNALPSTLFSRYYAHHHPKRLSLRTELALAILLSMVLGINAVLVTGVQGPALKVGNLYYSSWLSFLLCVRICLGCVEEYCNITVEDNDDCQLTAASSSDNASSSSEKRISSGVQVATPYKAPTLDVVGASNTTAAPTTSSGIQLENNVPTSRDIINTVAETQEKKRLGRVRGYFFLSIFSSVCSASSYDAASNQSKALSRDQMFMMYAPSIVAAISLLLFCLSLSKHCYLFISTFWVGGILSVLSFGLLVGDLLLTMHSETSWAVNSIGEIAMANLYYFAWASIITAGVQMTSYIKALFDVQKVDYMSGVWLAICKVCFIILGASLHIWHTISENCEFDEITLGAVSFCSRTILAIVVSLTGMLVGSLVILCRILLILCPVCRCGRFQAHIEMIISLFLMFLFVAAVALITGIGGPGQSVGDLYYSTWVAFWVSLGIFVSCYNQVNDKEAELEEETTLMENPGKGKDLSLRNETVFD